MWQFLRRWVGGVRAGWLLALCAVAFPAAALPPSAVLGSQDTNVRVEGHVQLLFERAGERLDAAAVAAPAMAERWQPFKGRKINLMRQLHPVWVRFAVRNEAPADRRWVLGVEWPLLDRIDLHPYDPVAGTFGPALHAGRNADPGTQARLLKDPAFVFPLDVPSGASREVFLRVATDSAFFVPLAVSEATDFQARRFDTAVLMGALFGLLGVMFLYNAAIAGFAREPMYGVYSVYLLAVLLYELAVTGYGALYVWPDVPWLMAHAYEVFACASFLAATVFFRYFLGLRHTGPRHIRRINTAVIAYWVIALAVSILWPNRWNSASIALFGLLASVLGVYSSVVLIVQGNRSARYFGIAWAVVIVGTLASLLSLVGVVEGNAFTNNAQHIGFCLEVLLLAIALADRIRRDRQAREAAQREALELVERVREEREQKIVAQEHAIALQARANEDLELRVLDRTAELERAMKNLELANVALSKLSVTDALTKVHNRRYFDEVMEKEYARSERTGVPLAVVLIDIDHFKRVNDTCGHLAGDECLRLVAAALRRTAGRSTDLVARYGGEEFALVLPGTDIAQALDLAERIRLAVAGIDFIYRGQRVPISVSLGVVARVASIEQPIADFIAEADAALYRAKDAGRNRVMLAA